MDPLDTVEDIKEDIQENTGIPSDQQQLTYREEVLNDEHALSTCNLETISTLHLTFKPEGLCIHQLYYIYIHSLIFMHVM